MVMAMVSSHISNLMVQNLLKWIPLEDMAEYRKKHKQVNIRAVKHWCRQILRGLLYLHSHDPPVIHRDLKCDNIFVNGNTGEVKIGDLGLAAFLRKSHVAHCVGTPEFMAPEVYKEEYNELVDIYSFGMCILEMVTFEYPYTECTHPVQIYKRVISGKKPEALYKVKDPEVQQFVAKCLATVSSRLSARELLEDSFLQIDDRESDLTPIKSQRDFNAMSRLLRQPSTEPCDGYLVNTNQCSDAFNLGTQNGMSGHLTDIEPTEIELFDYNDDEHSQNVNISIKGKKRENDSIFLRLRIADEGFYRDKKRVRNIYFPFDIQMDTALSVATEMVTELEITDQDVSEIADMIDGEIASLEPKWKPRTGIKEAPHSVNSNSCQKCASKFNHASNIPVKFMPNGLGDDNLEVFYCSCSTKHGRFEEVTYQVNENEANHVNLDALHFKEIWDQDEGYGSILVSSGQNHCHSECKQPDQETLEEENMVMTASHCRNCTVQLNISNSFSEGRLFYHNTLEDEDEQTPQKSRRFKSKHRMNERAKRSAAGKYRKLLKLVLFHIRRKH